MIKRKWIKVNDEKKSKKKHVFTVLTQNVMAARYTNVGRHQYPWVDSQHINGEYRTNVLIQHLLHYDADIVCLQELSFQAFEMIQKSKLSKSYRGEYLQKTSLKSWLRTEKEPEEPDHEGVAVLWKVKRFAMVKFRRIFFNNESYKDCLRLAEKDRRSFIYATALLSHNVSLVCVLEHVKTGNQIVVSTIHNSYKKHTDQQLWQVETYFENVKSFMEENAFKNLPLLLCGDFNLSYKFKAFEFIRNGKLEQDLILTSDNIYQKLLRNPTHGLKVRESYPRKEKKYTHYSCDKKHLDSLDFIFYGTLREEEQDKMDTDEKNETKDTEEEAEIALVRPINVLEIPDFKEKFPNEKVISDHILIGCQFEFVKKV